MLHARPTAAALSAALTLCLGAVPAAADLSACLDAADLLRVARVLDPDGKPGRKHEYSLEQFGLEPTAIRTELDALFDRFGWENDAPAPAGAASESGVHLGDIGSRDRPLEA